MLADKFILDLEHVELHNKELLPDYSEIYEIYYVIDRQYLIWYIGRSILSDKRGLHAGKPFVLNRRQEVSGELSTGQKLKREPEKGFHEK